ncbi:MAG: NAD(P)H-binding protein [Deltaproteobacteria bacterium]|nr:NAD(P)H-binding protein [Deltaproteobacteria bacterium]
MSVCILGANGFIGTNLVRVLAARGADFRCVRRKTSNVLALRQLKAKLVAGDLDDPESLVRAFTGHEVVIHAAGHYPRSSLRPRESTALALRQTQHALDAAARAKVKRLVFVSTMATVAARPGGLSDERHRHAGAPGFGTYHDLKWEMETLVANEARFETVVVCPGACLGPDDWRIGTQALLLALARGIDPPHPDGTINTVDVRDVALALATIADLSGPPRRLLIASENLSLHAMLAALCDRYRVPKISPPISADAARAIADAEERAVDGTPRRAALAREIVDLVVHGVAVDATLSRRVLGLRYRSLHESLDAFDAWARRMGLLNPPPVPETHP